MKKVGPGTAVFATISEAIFRGVVTAVPTPISPSFLSSGILEFEEDGCAAKLLFTVDDFQV